MYVHRWSDGSAIDLPVGKVVCIGRNYAEHAQELNNPIPKQPLLFIKPMTALTSMQPSWMIPENQGVVHHELELALLIGERLSKTDSDEAMSSIQGVGLGLDLTLRDVQEQLKHKGQPWERAKAFDGSCPMSEFVALRSIADVDKLSLSLMVNSEQRQSGCVADMIVPLEPLMQHICQTFTLLPGDIVLTGTPAGVGPVVVNDSLSLRLFDDRKTYLQLDTRVAQ